MNLRRVHVDTWVDPDRILAIEPSFNHDEQCRIHLAGAPEPLLVDVSVEAALGALEAFEAGVAAAGGGSLREPLRGVVTPRVFDGG